MKNLLLLGLVVCAAATQWEPETRLTDNDYPDFCFWSTQRRVVVDPEGRVHVAWHVMNPGLEPYRFQVHYMRWYPATGWTADTMLSADLYDAGVFCKYPSLAVDSAGTVHAVWVGGATDAADSVIYHKSCVPSSSGNGGWEDASRALSVTGPGVRKNCPTVTATPDGRVHAAWLEGTSIVCRERHDTTWLAPLVVEGGGNYKAYPAVAGGPDNRLHLTWYGREGTSGYYDVFYKNRTDTIWGTTENVSHGVRHQMYQSVAVNPVTAEPHVLWQSYGAGDNKRRIVHRRRTESGWQPTDTVSGRNDTLNQGTGQIVFTGDGRGHALWSGRSPEWPTLTQVRYSECSASGDWLPPFNVTDTGGSKERPAIAAGAGDAPDDVHAVWCDYRDSNAEIYYSRGGGAQFVSDRPPVRVPRPAATIICGGLFLPRMTDDRFPMILLNASGRKVMELGPGENDVRHLAPGVYFVREKGSRIQGVKGLSRKVVIQR